MDVGTRKGLQIVAYMFVVIVAMATVATYDAVQRGKIEHRVEHLTTVIERPGKIVIGVGKRGSQGIRGAAGSNGKDGAQGIQGAAGIRGPAGPAGPPGPRGERGPEGRQGSAGPAGINGVSPSVQEIVSAVCARIPLC